MSIKSVLFTALYDQQSPNLPGLSCALDVVAEHKAHLGILVGAVKVPEVMFSGVADVSPIIFDENGAREKGAQALAESLSSKAVLNGATAQVEAITDIYDPLMRRIAGRARLYDLVVAEQPPSESYMDAELAQRLVMECGRPVLVVPRGTNEAGKGPVIVAWDGSANAARALTAAMPLIERNGAVDIVCVTPGKGSVTAVPGTDLAPMLAHHGLKVSVTDLKSDGSVGATVLAHARMTKASLVVMGAYAHSKLHQIVWGGVTQHALANAHLPVLMAH